MTFAVRHLVIQNSKGDLQTGASIEVRLDVPSKPLAHIYRDRAGTDELPNPFITPDGMATIFAAGGAYRIKATKGAFAKEDRYVPIGRGAETDLAVVTPKGEWNNVDSYNAGDLLTALCSDGQKRGFISLQDGNVNHAPPTNLPIADTEWWTLSPGVTTEQAQQILEAAEGARDATVTKAAEAAASALAADASADAAAQSALEAAGAVAGVATFEGRSGAVTSQSGDYAASEITNTPAGTIAANNVQAAINELDGDVSSLSTAVAASLKKDVEDQVITGGASVTIKDLGTPTAASTVTLDMSKRPIQKITNNAAFILAPDSADGHVLLFVVNGSTAGTITLSGFDYVLGDPPTNTNGHRFLYSIYRIDGFDILFRKALQ
jgi:hypothetical protein